ncbi:alpha/beta hydrolase [bacterium]|nr:MAG: alpha/beta hydrolase [bacterium]
MKRIALIHGWNYKNYSACAKSDNAWEDRADLLKEIGKDFEVFGFNLPGFCRESEPKNSSWEIEDFARYFENLLVKKNFVPDVVLGYSFGGAIALKWKILFKKDTKVVLVSPALLRAYSNKKPQSVLRKVVKTLLPNFLIEILRDFYLAHIVKNPYYYHGTKFLRRTYLNIVSVDMSEELQNVLSNEVQLIFGENDTATPPQLLLEKIQSQELKNRFAIIKDGDHDIGQTHYKEICEVIKKFME